jgi:hypothetical protein
VLDESALDAECPGHEALHEEAIRGLQVRLVEPLAPFPKSSSGVDERALALEVERIDEISVERAQLDRPDAAAECLPPEATSLREGHRLLPIEPNANRAGLTLAQKTISIPDEASRHWRVRRNAFRSSSQNSAAKPTIRRRREIATLGAHSFGSGHRDPESGRNSSTARSPLGKTTIFRPIFQEPACPVIQTSAAPSASSDKPGGLTIEAIETRAKVTLVTVAPRSSAPEASVKRPVGGNGDETRFRDLRLPFTREGREKAPQASSAFPYYRARGRGSRILAALHGIDGGTTGASEGALAAPKRHGSHSRGSRLIETSPRLADRTPRS